MGVLTEIGSATGSFLDGLFSLDRFGRAGRRVGVVGDALVGGMLALTALGLRAVGRTVPALLRRSARAARELRAADLLALGITAAAAALLIRSKVWQLLTVGGLLVLAGFLRRRKEEEQRRLVELLVTMDGDRRRAFIEAANQGDMVRAKEVLAGAT
ncbi:MAG: hypothetical protein KAX80_01655 [Planctomycetes bacterium]|nr:hypothetical protein [Planctomycetota bacterium]